jgi:hypothetical protein
MKDEKIYPSMFNHKSNKAICLSFVIGAIYGLAQRFIFTGHLSIGDHPLQIMSVSFAILVPLAIGAMRVYLEEQKNRRSIRFYLYGSELSTLYFLVGWATTMQEVTIFILIASPLFLLLSSIGGLIMGLVCRFQDKSRRLG